MAKLSRIADVQISIGTLAITEKAFNRMLILSSNANLVDRVTVITDPDDLLDLGVLSTDPLYAAASDAFSQTPHVNELYIGMQDTAALEDTATALAACEAEAPGYWYGLINESRVEQDVKDTAAWAEANEKLFGTATDDPGALTSATTDLGSALQTQNYMRTFVCYSSEAATEYPEAGLMSQRFTYYPGAEGWANVQLSGLTSDSLTEAEYGFAQDKNITTFEQFRNFSVTQGGKVAGGEWIDVIRFRDQLVESIKVSVVGAIVRATNSTGKLPYTDAGIQVIKAAIRQPLDQNVSRGGLAGPTIDDQGNVVPSYRIQVPRAVDVPANDKANRVLKDVNFSARLSGAIHTVEIKGSLVYDFNAGA